MKKKFIVATLASCVGVIGIAGCGNTTIEENAINELKDAVLYIMYDNKLYLQEEPDSISEKSFEEMRGEYLGETVYKEYPDVVSSVDEVKKIFEYDNMSSNIGDGYSVYNMKDDEKKILCEVRGEGQHKIIVLKAV